MTGEALAQASGVSRSMLSRIERGLVSPSVDTIGRLATGLGVSVAQLFADPDERVEVSLVRRGQGVLVATPGTDGNAHCILLGHLPASGALVEPYLVQLDQAPAPCSTDRHAGLQFLHLLSGRMRYRCGSQVYELSAGDSLTFQTAAPHGVESVDDRPVAYLLVVCRGQSDQAGRAEERAGAACLPVSPTRRRTIR